MDKKFLKIDGFILRIIGMIAMTFDHLGLFIQIYDKDAAQVGLIFRYIGRLAFPIFVFMLVEGWYHTKHPNKYLLRLGILAATLLIPHFVIYQFMGLQLGGNPLIELFFLGLFLYCLKLKGPKKLFALLPAAYILLCFFVALYEYQNSTLKVTVLWLPEYLRCDYSLLGLFLVGIFYAVRPTAKLFIKLFHKGELDYEEYSKTDDYRFLLNCIAVGFFLTLILGMWAIVKLFTDASGYCSFDVFSISWEAYCLFAAIPIFFYSGKKGYTSKYWRTFYYSYFPVHLAILCLIFVLKFGI